LDEVLTTQLYNSLLRYGIFHKFRAEDDNLERLNEWELDMRFGKWAIMSAESAEHLKYKTGYQEI
jgi:hypothetical protein